jgi:hypothetical protein
VDRARAADGHGCDGVFGYRTAAGFADTCPVKRLALVVGLVMAVGAVPSAASAAPVPGTTCTVFPADNVWNTDISALPVDSHSKTWLASMKASTTKLHPDFGGPPYGFPFAVVDNSHPTASIAFDYADESDPGPYPFDANTPIEQGSDRHALMINKDTCTLYELFDAKWNGGAPTAGSGAVFDLNSNALRPNGWTSADAAGLPIFPGLVRWDEVQAGFIGHAIRFTVSCTYRLHYWPARHDAGTSNSKCPPMGARFRLRAGYDISGYGADAQVVLTAMKHYGLILADNGSNWYFQGTEDAGWPNSLLDDLKKVPASQFRAVDEAACKVSKDSAQDIC